MSERVIDVVPNLVRGQKRDGRCIYDRRTKQELVRRCQQPGVSVPFLDDRMAQFRGSDHWLMAAVGDMAFRVEGCFIGGGSVDGRFKADIDGAKPGIIFKAVPVVGQTYLEGFSLGNAEDIAQVFSKTYHFGEDKELDRFVPPNLAKLLCHHDCVVTENTSLLEPGVVERKYYAPGIGTYLETNPDSGEITRLVKCNFHELCASLPVP